MRSSPTWSELLETARWSPSPHNIQPWRLRVQDDDAAELVCETTRLLPATDPTGCFSAVGLGVFIETMAIAARARDVDVAAELLHEPLVPNGRATIPFARLRLVPGVEDAIPAALIVRRRTSRLPYDGRAVEPHVLDEAARVAADWGHTATFSSDAELVAFVLDLNRETLFSDLTNERARDEIGRWLRFDARSAAATRDGFSPAALGFPGWLLSLFFHHHRAFELPGVRTLVRRLYMRTMAGTTTIGLLQGPFEDVDEWVRAGRMLARFWLTLTRHDVCLHPFGSVITNSDANRRMQERLTPEPRHGTSWLVVRLGHSAEPPRSHRRTVDELLLR
jgi:nitroreductase